MELTEYFALEVDDPGQERGPGVAPNRYSVHLGWTEGVPYLVDLGGADDVLVNGDPIPSRQRVALEPGDTITIGNAHLTWRTGEAAQKPTRILEKPQFTKVTVVLPEDAAEAEPPAPKGEEAPAVPATGETLLVPKRPAPKPGEAQGPEDTLLAPGKVAGPAEPEIPDATLIVPKAAAPPPPPEPEEADATLLAPKAPPPAEPELLEPTLLAPKAPLPAEPGVLDPTLLAPKAAAPPPPGAGDEFTYETVWVDMAQLFEQDVPQPFEATTIQHDTRTAHLVIHLADRTWPVPLTGERMTIGRSEENDIPVPDNSLSRHHAAIEPRGDQYVIRDTQSTNGVWLGRQRVDQHRLETGDVLSLGRAKLVFKGSFSSDDLTLIRPPQTEAKPARRPVVFVPGLMGSELWIGSEQIWPNLKYLLSNPEVYRLPSDPRIEARNIVSDVVIVPNLIKLRQYSGLGDYLVAGLGYERGTDLLEFAYDWRQDVRLAAQSLAETIEGWQAGAPVTIIAHSLGTLVTRYYVERLGGKRSVERIILMGGPHYGAPSGLSALLTGPGMLPMGMGDERLRSVLSTLPSAYQILPTYPSVTDQHGQTIDLLNDESWLPEPQRPLLRAGRSFRRELGELSSVPTVSIFGYGLKTKLRATIHRGRDGIWRKVEFSEDTAGDSSVPSGSAVLKDSEIHPVFQDHGSLYVDDDVRMRLKVELTRSTTWRRR